MATFVLNPPPASMTLPSLTHLEFIVCGCLGAATYPIQLLCLNWFPGSWLCPSTAFTFNFLNTFDLVNTQGQVNAYDFCYTFDHKSNNTGLHETKVSFIMSLWVCGIFVDI